MSSTKSDRKQERAERASAKKRSNILFGLVVAGIAFVFVAAIAVAKNASDESSSPTETKSGQVFSGSEKVLGVASDVSLISLGHVPLNQTVSPNMDPDQHLARGG
jgi:hypothetical protein